ncbi:MAG: spondin domain-containing protein, partial [Chitinophagales bacterium]
MMNKAVFFAFALFTFFATSCDKDDDNPVTTSSFKVTITNAFAAKAHFSTGVFTTPLGASEAGPLFPDQSYQFTVEAAKPSHQLFFSTMYVQSNDLFLSNNPQGGFPFYDASGSAIGSATYTVDLWDSGTEVNQEPGVGNDQAPRQSGANVGQAENGTVQLIENVSDGFTYPSGDQIAKIRIEYNSGSMFTVTITNTSGTSILPSPLAPGAWVVTNA